MLFSSVCLRVISLKIYHLDFRISPRLCGFFWIGIVSDHHKGRQTKRLLEVFFETCFDKFGNLWRPTTTTTHARSRLNRFCDVLHNRELIHFVLIDRTEWKFRSSCKWVGTPRVSRINNTRTSLNLLSKCTAYFNFNDTTPNKGPWTVPHVFSYMHFLTFLQSAMLRWRNRTFIGIKPAPCDIIDSSTALSLHFKLTAILVITGLSWEGYSAQCGFLVSQNGRTKCYLYRIVISLGRKMIN